MPGIEESAARLDIGNSVSFCGLKQISDNIMIAQEMFHALRTKPSGRNKRMAVKTDMSKAYDRMEWSFIEAVMRKMDFSETWTTG